MAEIVRRTQSSGKKVVQHHRQFDVLNPGHLDQLRHAKAQGDLLVVTLSTSKSSTRTARNPNLDDTARLEFISAFPMVDYVAVHDSGDAVDVLRAIRPDVYSITVEREPFVSPVATAHREAAALKEWSGRLHILDDSLSTALEGLSESAFRFLGEFKQEFNGEEILSSLDRLSGLNVLVIGEAILDEYEFIEPLGQSGKGLHMVVRSVETETYLGGSLAVANTVRNFCGNVTLVAGLGSDDPSGSPLVREGLHPSIELKAFSLKEARALRKRRFVLKDGDQLSKLFEVYSSSGAGLEASEEKRLGSFLCENAGNYDLVLACDFGNGLVSLDTARLLSQHSKFLAVNAQINSGNRGYHVVTRYPSADYVTLNEPELRLTTHDRVQPLEVLAKNVMERMQCKSLACTRGTWGMHLYSNNKLPFHIPALSTRVRDRVGAGDNLLAISALALAGGVPLEIAGFLGSVAAALNVQIEGNKRAVDSVTLKNYMKLLLK